MNKVKYLAILMGGMLSIAAPVWSSDNFATWVKEGIEDNNSETLDELMTADCQAYSRFREARRDDDKKSFVKAATKTLVRMYAELKPMKGTIVGCYEDSDCPADLFTYAEVREDRLYSVFVESIQAESNYDSNKAEQHFEGQLDLIRKAAGS